MTATPQDGTREPSTAEIREQYDEYEVGESLVGVISDPENEHAWIWSDVLEPLEG